MLRGGVGALWGCGGAGLYRGGVGALRGFGGGSGCRAADQPGGLLVGQTVGEEDDAKGVDEDDDVAADDVAFAIGFRVGAFERQALRRLEAQLAGHLGDA